MYHIAGAVFHISRAVIANFVFILEKTCRCTQPQYSAIYGLDVQTGQHVCLQQRWMDAVALVIHAVSMQENILQRVPWYRGIGSGFGFALGFGLGVGFATRTLLQGVELRGHVGNEA